MSSHLAIVYRVFNIKMRISKAIGILSKVLRMKYALQRDGFISLRDAEKKNTYIMTLTEMNTASLIINRDNDNKSIERAIKALCAISNNPSIPKYLI